MLGTLRFFLSSIVALSHFGEFSGPAGSVAVFGFFSLSGFLMTRTYFHVYLPLNNSIFRFYVNRILRIFPLYIFYFTLTILLYKLHVSHIFIIGTEYISVVNIHIAQMTWVQYFGELSLGFLNPSFNSILHGSNFIVLQQAWSLVLEIQFYISVPLLALIIKRKSPIFLLFSIFIIFIIIPSFNFLEIPFTTPPSKSFIGCYFIFVLGVLFNFIKIEDSTINKGYASLLFLFLFIYFIWAMKQRQPTLGQAGELWFYSFLISVMIAMGSTISFKNVLAVRVDKFLGNISYGIFLNHFFAGAILLLIAEQFSKIGLLLPPITHTLYPGYPGSAWFRYAELFISILFSSITYFILEQPIEKFRQFLKSNKQ